MTRSSLWIPAAAVLLAINVAATVVLATRVSPAASAAPAAPPAVEHATDWRIRTGVSSGDLVVIVTDRIGSPIGDAHVSMSAPGIAHGDLPLQGMAYRGTLPTGKGHHDITIVVERGGARYVQYSSVDVP
jgi:hypothetical protein